MIGVLMVAEKPFIAETISKILSHGQSVARRNKCTPVHEFQGKFNRRDANFRVTSTTGHIFSLDFPSKYNNWDSVDPESLFDAPVSKSESQPKSHMPDHLAREAAHCDHLVLWLDCDREGENICFEVIHSVYHQLKNSKPSHKQHQNADFDNISFFNYYNEQFIWRSKFSSLEDSDIKRAMMNLVSPNQNEAESVDARQEIDLKVGCAFTRFQTRYFHSKYADLDSSLISFGPCQIPTLYFCVQRHDEIQGFQPEKTFDLQIRVPFGMSELTLDWYRGKLYDRTAAYAFYDNIKGEQHMKIVDLEEKMETIGRPKALNTVELLRQASKCLSIGPHEAMKVAERLYLNGYITYPRTETTKYPPKFDFRKIVGSLTADSDFGVHAAQLLKTECTVPSSGKDVGDHPPITPVKHGGGLDLSGDALRMYKMICRHFLCTLSKDCRYANTTVKFKVKNEFFLTTGKKIIEPGFTQLQSASMSNKIEKYLPQISRQNIGEFYEIKSINLVEGQTTPPPLLSESDLLTLMEENGVGTDASMPTHINNILERKYVELTGNRCLCPTRMGVSLTHGYLDIDPELVLPSVRANIESSCDLIAKGGARRFDVVGHTLNEFKMKYKHYVASISKMDLLFEASFSSVTDSGQLFSLCGICERYMKLIDSKLQRLYCNQCDTIYETPQGGQIKQYNQYRCPLDSFELVLFKQKGGRTYPLCPMCYNNPPFEDASIGKSTMSCVDCLHPTCRHSLITNAVCMCAQIQCNGMIYLDVLSAPKWKLECNVCKYRVELLHNAHKISVTDKLCENCKIRLLDVTFHKSDPNVASSEELRRTACIACDPEISKRLEGKFASSRGLASKDANRTRSRGHGRRNSRGRRNA